MAETRQSTRDSAHARTSNAKSNSLRAAVLGSNDGVVSVSSIILGVAGASSSRTAIIAAGIAGLAAGALSMAAGEYVSVSSQRDIEHTYIATEKWRLKHHPEEEFDDLAEVYEKKGLSKETARKVVEELTAHNAIKAHLDAEFHIDEEDLSSPIAAALSSLGAFTAGGLIPLAAVSFVPTRERIAGTVAAVLVTLGVTGYISARVSRTSLAKVIIRVMTGGGTAMLITYAIGHIFGGIVG